MKLKQGHWSGPLVQYDWCPYKKRRWGHGLPQSAGRRGEACLQARERGSEGPANTSTLALQPPGLGEHEFLLSRSPSLQSRQTDILCSLKGFKNPFILKQGLWDGNLGPSGLRLLSQPTSPQQDRRRCFSKSFLGSWAARVSDVHAEARRKQHLAAKKRDHGVGTLHRIKSIWGHREKFVKLQNAFYQKGSEGSHPGGSPRAGELGHCSGKAEGPVLITGDY